MPDLGPPSKLSRTPSRREFLALTGLGSALWLAPALSRAMPVGARAPAPAEAPPNASRAEQALRNSPLHADEAVAVAALEAAVAAGASFADVRLVRYRNESIGVRDDHVSEVRRREEYGVGVRVLTDSGWGFAATGTVTKNAAVAAARQAAAAAQHSAKLRRELSLPPVVWAAAPTPRGTWVAPHELDPFEVPLQDKTDLLVAAAQATLSVHGVSNVRAGVTIVGEDRLYLNSEGARTHQIAYRLAPSLQATAVNRRLGRFASRALEVAPMQGGWEYVTDLDLLAAARPVGDDALKKLYATSVEPGPRSVILAPSNLWLTIHESIGHPTELDRSMGLEANFAGTSFIKPTDAGTLKIGSKGVNIVADRTQPGGLSTVAWDDDGVKTQRWDILRDGTFVGWQTTRDQAAAAGDEHSRGCSYGQGYGGLQFQRMPNMSLQPGTEGYTTEDLINATEDGILISGRGSWSIDQQRYNFQFSGQMYWEIKRGRITQPLRDVAYQANTVDFWQSCDMLGGKDTYRLGGSFQDGKGAPRQSNAVSHGCPPARFRVNVVNTGADA